MKIKPLRNRVLLEPVQKEDKTEGGILIPQDAQKDVNMAMVVKVGDRVNAEDVRKGDTVIFQRFGGYEVEVDGKKYLIMKAKEILARVD